MKKIISIIFAAICLLGFCSCESKEERAARIIADKIEDSEEVISNTVCMDFTSDTTTTTINPVFGPSKSKQRKYYPTPEDSPKWLEIVKDSKYMNFDKNGKYEEKYIKIHTPSVSRPLLSEDYYYYSCDIDCIPYYGKMTKEQYYEEFNLEDEPDESYYEERPEIDYVIFMPVSCVFDEKELGTAITIIIMASDTQFYYMYDFKIDLGNQKTANLIYNDNFGSGRLFVDESRKVKANLTGKAAENLGLNPNVIVFSDTKE